LVKARRTSGSPHTRVFLCATGALACLVATCFAEETPQAEPAPADAKAGYLLAAGTQVQLRLLDTVASNTHKKGDRFRLEVVAPVVVDSHVLIAAGTPAEGEVIHASKGGMAGRPGELILATRLIRLNATEVKLRAFVARTGKDDTDLAAGLSIVVIGLFMSGGNIVVSDGTEVIAKIAADTVLPAIAIATPEETTDDGPTREEDTGSVDREPAGDDGGVREQPGTVG
jgi:hypothetical protein